MAELRRIERDLHDGAQARLVAVGMSLRAAEQLMPSSPEAALALVAEARQTSTRALDDLRSWCAPFTRRCSPTAAWATPSAPGAGRAAAGGNRHHPDRRAAPCRSPRRSTSASPKR